LLKIIDFGLQVKAFLASGIGQRLVKDSEDERATLMESLIGVDIEDPADRKRWRERMFRIAVLDHWQ